MNHEEFDRIANSCLFLDFGGLSSCEPHIVTQVINGPTFNVVKRIVLNKEYFSSLMSLLSCSLTHIA